MVQVGSLFLLFKAVILIMGRLSQEGYQARYAIVEFLADVHTILPPYWYKLDGDDLGSVACLFGLSEPDLLTLLMTADVVGKKGNGLVIKRNNFDEMLKLLPIEIQGVQLEKSGIPDESKMKTRSAKKAPPKTIRPYFLRVGSSKAARGWKSFDKASEQVKNGMRPPRASINFPQKLLAECDVVSKIVADRVSSLGAPAKPNPPAPMTPASRPAPPSVTPAMTSNPVDSQAAASVTPFLDNFVWSRDKGDRNKLTGVLQEVRRTGVKQTKL
jgi:hypothetical protein